MQSNLENPESCMHTGVIGVSDSELGVCAQFLADFQARFYGFFKIRKKRKKWLEISIVPVLYLVNG